MNAEPNVSPRPALRGAVHAFLSRGGPRIQGPFAWEAGSALASSILAFRRRGYAESMPHLLDAKVERREAALRLDARALHFVAEEDGSSLVAAVRVLPRPYEFELLCSDLQACAAQKPRHLELSRLLVDTRGSTSVLSTRLLFAAGEWAWSQGGSTGFWALCSGPRSRLFRRFGMKVVRDGIALPDRPGRFYSLLEADFPALAAAAGAHLLLEGA